ncbi:hypothetical protein Q4601_19790 [Shewanella sp. 1_MG-2023]|uniref:hypothetical protein n=1 Tax=unclassified Shewanella TaxID=196818 RepID=UPI0026E1A607|nr:MULTISPECIES: hypothetical protein [unclassified Shewanella]MDO6613733.1 hypothetical protein [Shewanella sp. 7_MG-2023]MDO6772659.1 hypothetical protein [Shewanella sp. 2_MG-2023]MDO6796537.1 hypothetical protein [Shewanella sp. 1_MG-2023]
MKNFEEKIYLFISVKKLTIPISIMFVVLVISCLIVLYLCALATFKKLDDSAIYNVDTMSEAFEYSVISKTAPDILLNRFVPIKHSCSSMENNQEYLNGNLSLNSGVKVLIERKSTEMIKLTAVFDSQTDNGDKKRRLGTLINDFERCKLYSSVVFNIKLSPQNPIFSLNVIGDIQIGRVIGDAPDGYYPLVQSGQIIIQDKATFTHSLITLSPHLIRPGDTVKMTETKGIIRASHEHSGLTGIFQQTGHQILLSRLYSKTPNPVKPSFFDRVMSDGELAFALSTAIIFIQFIGFCITILFRLALFSSTSGETNELP